MLPGFVLDIDATIELAHSEVGESDPVGLVSEAELPPLRDAVPGEERRAQPGDVRL